MNDKCPKCGDSAIKDDMGIWQHEPGSVQCLLNQVKTENDRLQKECGEARTTCEENAKAASVIERAQARRAETLRRRFAELVSENARLQAELVEARAAVAQLLGNAPSRSIERRFVAQEAYRKIAEPFLARLAELEGIAGKLKKPRRR